MKEELGINSEEKAWVSNPAVQANAEPSSFFLLTSSFISVADRGLYGAFLLVMLMVPFEAGYPPLTRFFNATFTNLELTLLLLSAALVARLAVDAGARARLLSMPLLLPAVALIGASAAAYLFGEYKAQGVNSTYRLLMGVVVLCSAWLALRTTKRLLLALGTVAAVGFISAVLGLLEFSPWINMEPWLAAFKPAPTTVGGALRLSGSFEYANGAAVFFELMLPVVVCMAMVFSSERLLASIEGVKLSRGAVRVLRVALFAACGIISLAMLLTFSRAALAGLAVGLLLIGLACVGLRIGRRGVRVKPVFLGPLAVALALMALGAAYIYLTQPVFRLRFSNENDRTWYNVSYEAGQVPALAAGEWVSVPLTLRNNGPMIWRAEGALSVYASYHWMSSDQTTYLVFEGARTPLPADVGPGESITVDGFIQAPAKPGVYYLQWDLVQEDVTWFSYKSGLRYEPTKHEVSAYTAADGQQRPPGNLPPPVSVQAALNTDTSTVARSQLWSVALKMFRAHPLTGVGPDGFRNLYGRYAGVTQWDTNIYTNNTYIEMFTNLGIVGGLAFLWLVVLGLWHAGRNLVREPMGVGWILGLGATAALVAHTVHGLADYFLFSTPLYISFWLVLAVAALWPGMISQPSVKQNRLTLC